MRASRVGAIVGVFLVLAAVVVVVVVIADRSERTSAAALRNERCERPTGRKAHLHRRLLALLRASVGARERQARPSSVRSRAIFRLHLSCVKLGGSGGDARARRLATRRYLLSNQRRAEPIETHQSRNCCRRRTSTHTHKSQEEHNTSTSLRLCANAELVSHLDKQGAKVRPSHWTALEMFTLSSATAPVAARCSIWVLSSSVSKSTQ